MSSPFDPQEFFTNSANFLSQGRGLFKLNMAPACLSKPSDEIAHGLQLLQTGLVTKSFALPAQQLATYEGTTFQGPNRKIAHGIVFGDIGVTFLLMSKEERYVSAIYKTLIAWQLAAAGPLDPRESVRSDTTQFGVRYYDDYVVDATATIYSPSSETPSITVQYNELFPVTVGDIAVSWDNPDAPVTLTTTFAYHFSSIKG